jgi:hypothetical protein
MSRAFQYQLFDLIAGADQAIPGLTPESRRGQPDISIHLGTRPRGEHESQEQILWYESGAVDATGKPALQIWNISGGPYLRADYFDSTKFWLEKSGKEVWVSWSEGSSLNVAISYLLGPIFGVVLRLRGITCLHGSAVSIAGRGAIFIGPPGAGKSTTAAALAQRGHPVLSDDIVALSKQGDSLEITPAYPHLCLWPDSMEMLLGSGAALLPLAEDSDKKKLPLDGAHGTFGKEAVSVAGIYLLGERRAGTRVFLNKVPPQEALISLISNVFGTNLPVPNQAASDLPRLVKLLEQASVRRIHADADPRQIFSLCEYIESDIAAGSAHPL